MVQIDTNACIGCGLCVRDCIAGNLSLSHDRAQVGGPCFLCGHCVAICPRNAASIPSYDMADVEPCTSDNVALEPLQLLRAIKFRRSVRDYLPRTVTPEVIDLLIQAGRYSATAKNTQGCRFIVVQHDLEAFRTLIWDGLGQALVSSDSQIRENAQLYRRFYESHRADVTQDYLFRNAPAVLFVAADNTLDAGLAIQNMELVAVAQGMGFLYNGYLRRAAELLPDARAFLGADEKSLAACALLGYPARVYARTAPRRTADVVLR